MKSSLIDLTGFEGDEKISRLHEGACAVADVVLNRIRKFRESLLVAVGDEEGIVTEAAVAARCEYYHSLANAFRNI